MLIAFVNQAQNNRRLPPLHRILNTNTGAMDAVKIVLYRAPNDAMISIYEALASLLRRDLIIVFPDLYHINDNIGSIAQRTFSLYGMIIVYDGIDIKVIKDRYGKPRTIKTWLTS